VEGEGERREEGKRGPETGDWSAHFSLLQYQNMLLVP